MPRAIAIETSGKLGSIAIADGAKILVEETFPHGLQHAAQIVPILDRLCKSQRWNPQEIEHLYISAGPGSFTGLRIAVTLAKTMTLASAVKLVAVSSVRVLAENAPADAQHLIIVLDAKRDQIFTARFEKIEGRWEVRDPAQLSNLESMLAKSPRPVHLLGEGIAYHEKFIPRNDQSVIVTPENGWRARAAAVAKIGAEMASRGEFVDPMKFTPIYLRLPEAEEKWIAQQTVR